MDFPENESLEAAFAEAEAQAKLAAELREAKRRFAEAGTPDRLNEDWRFGSPHKYARPLVELLESDAEPCGKITIDAPADCAWEEAPEGNELMRSIGSDKLLGLHIRRCRTGAVVFLDEGVRPKNPIVITYETDGLFIPHTSITAAPGSKAHIIERHITKGRGVMFCTRAVSAAPDCELKIELLEQGSGESRAMNITHILAMSAKVGHLTKHSNHAWAREETIAEILQNDTDVRLCSANRLGGDQVLDQHTRQVHLCGNARSDLLYKNVVDDNAIAVFAGNIYVDHDAHYTDAYQANRNMLLSEKASVHSLPGLEILADKVRCSHGSASAPMDTEQLFYLLTRGIPRHEAQLLVAEGFLNDAVKRFAGE